MLLFATFIPWSSSFVGPDKAKAEEEEDPKLASDTGAWCAPACVRCVAEIMLSGCVAEIMLLRRSCY
jgi:hypothetical protein